MNLATVGYKQRKDFYGKVRRGEKVEALSVFEKNYYLAWNFKHLKMRPPSEKIRELVLLSKIKIRNDKEIYMFLREKKFPTGKKCFICGDRAYYHHHIIGLNNGGYNSSINRIPICETCHKEIHPWLGKRV